MGEDSYLDASYEDRYDDPWYAEYDSEVDEDFGDEYDDEEDDDFPEYLEYPQDYLEDIEPPF